MVAVRKPMDGLATGLMAALCVIWAMQQVALKATADDFPPVYQIGIRSGLGALLVLLFMWCRREHFQLGGVWRYGVLAGALYALEFLFVGEGLRHTSAGHSAVLLYTAPIFAALGLHWRLPEERLAPIQWLGIALAFAGVAIAFLIRDETVAPGGTMLWGDFLVLLGGLSWGATTVVIRVTPLSDLPPTQTLFYQLAAACLLLMVSAFLTGQVHFHGSPLVWSSLVFQVLGVAFLSYLAWFWLLRRYLASRLGVFSFCTPLFGVVLGAWLLDEPVGAGFIVGALLVLSGIVLLSGYGWYAQWIRRRRG